MAASGAEGYFIKQEIMSKGVVRQSKFRHVFGTPARKDACIEGFRVTNCAFEGNFIAANGKFVAACVEVGGGGAFIVLPIDTVSQFRYFHC